MKHKFSSMGRVAIALVLALSLSLVMAVPVSAAAGVITADRVVYAVEDTASFTITDTDTPATATVAYYSTTEGITVDATDVFTGIDTQSGGGATYTATELPLADTNEDGTLEVAVSAGAAVNIRVDTVDPITGDVAVLWDAGGSADDTITITYDYYPEAHIGTVDVSSGSATDTILVSATDALGTVQVADGGTLEAAYWDASEELYRFADTVINGDLEAPSLDNAVVIGENLVRVEMTDSDPGFDISTIEPADFTVDGEAVSVADAYDSSDWSSLANTDTAAAILLTTSQTISPGQGVTVAITNDSGGIADMVGNAITSGSFDTLGLSVTPSQVALGETVNLEGSITQDGLAYTGTAYWAVIGLSNGGTAVDGNITAGTSPVVLVKGSTANGSFVTAMTLDGVVTITGEVVRNYMVLVSTEDVFPAVDTVFITTEYYKPVDSGEDIINETVKLTKMGTGVLVSAVSGTVSPVGTLIKGDSAIVSGSLTKSDDTGISGYVVDVSAVGDSTNPDIDHDVIEGLVTVIASTTTAANGNFATSAVFDDAGVYAVTYPAYFTDARLLDTLTAADDVYNAVIDTITVGADSLTATTNTATAVHTITTTAGVVLTVEIDGAAPGADHIARFVLSGVNFDEIALADTTNDIIEQVTFSNGESFGTVSLGMTGLGATLDALSYVTAAEDYSIVTDDTVHITSVVLTSKTDGDDSIEFDVLFSGAGTLSIEGQVEQTDDDADTPEYPDYTGTTSMTVTTPARLNVLPNIEEFGVDLGADGTQDSVNLNLQIMNEDGHGLQTKGNQETTADNIDVADDKEIDTVTVTLTTTGTEFSITGFTAIGVADDGFDLSAIGDNLTEAVITTDTDDALWTSGDDDDEATALQFDALKFEQEGSLTVEVEVLFHDGDTVTETLTYDVAGESASVTLTSAMAGEVADVEVTVTKEGVAKNSRLVGLVASEADALSIDVDGDGVYEAGEIYTEVWYNPIADQLENSESIKIIDAAPVAGGLYDFGDVKFLKITKVDVQVRKTDHNGELTAFLQDQIDITGEVVYTLTPDVDSVVAGIANEVDLTVTEDGTQVTGATLDELVSNIAILQDSTDLSGTTVATVDTDADGNVDVIRLTVLYPEDVRTDTTLEPVTVSVETDDATKTGSLDIAAVEPAVALTIDGVAESKITRAFIEPVSITITDPRDGSEIATADLQVTATNLKLELDSTEDVFTDPGEDTTGQTYSATYLTDGLLLDPEEVASAIAEDSATYEFDALAHSLVAGETASITLEVCDNGSTWIVVATVSIEDATATVSPAEVLLGVQSFISMDAVDAHGQILADGTEAQLSGVVTSTGSLTNGAVSFAVTPSATGTINAEVEDDMGAWQTLGTVSVVSTLPPTTITWSCLLDHVALVAPFPANDRSFLTASADVSEVTCDADWFQVLWLDEGTGEWKYFLSQFEENTLLTLEPDQYYYVIVSAPCDLTVPQ